MKLAGATAGALALRQARVASAQEATPSPETQLEYWRRLTGQIQVDTGNVQGKDSITLGLKPEGKQTLSQMDINDPKNLTTTDFALIATLKEASTTGLPDDPATYTDYLTRRYDIRMLSDDLVRRYVTEPQAAGVVNSYLAPRTDGTFALNVKGVNVLSTLTDGSFKIAIPQETLNAAKEAAAAGPAENVPAVQPDAFATDFAGKRSASLTQAYAPSETPIPTPVATRTPAEIAEKASFDRMLGGFLCVVGLGGLATLLGIPFGLALSRGGGGRDVGWADPPDRYAPKTPSAEKVIERVVRERFPDSK